MKKNNKMVKFTAILATALMAVSATGISTSAQGVKKMEAARTANTSTQKSFKKYSKIIESPNLIALEGTSAKPGEEIAIPIKTYTSNTCSCYNVVIEYDSRLEFVSVNDSQAYCEFEQNGIKYVSVVGYSTDFYKDGEAVATINFRVPDEAENDNYYISFNEITSFSTDTEDYDDFAARDAVVTVTGGVEKQITGNCVQLRNVSGIAGDSAVVKVVPYSNNECSCYDMLIEYDPALTLEDSGVKGADSFTIFEEYGRCFVSLVGFTPDVYKDGKSMATLNFVLPEDAMPDETFSVEVVHLSNFATATEELPDVKVYNAVISTAAAFSDGLGSYKTFKKIVNGEIVETKVGLRGDINCDGIVNVRDASTTARYVVTGDASKLTEEGLYYADVDDNDAVNIRDAAKIARYVVKGQW